MFKKKKLTQKDVLNMLPIPPVGTMWKIWVGKKFVAHQFIEFTDHETYPFVLGLLKDDDSKKDEVLFRGSVRDLTEEYVRQRALEILSVLVKKNPEYSLVQSTDSDIVDKLHLIGYYAANRSDLTR
jgi:hypothetical protein